MQEYEAFLGLVALFQNPKFFNEIKPGKFQKDAFAKEYFSLLAPVTLDGKAYTQQLLATGCYKHSNLQQYFASIAALYIDKPIGLLLSNYNHSISIAYDPKSSHAPWAFVDANNSEITYLTLDELSAAVVNAFEFDRSGPIKDHVTFETRFFCGGAHKPIDSLKSDALWQKLHSLETYAAAKQSSEFKVDDLWLKIAIRAGDLVAVQSMLTHTDKESNFIVSPEILNVMIFFATSFNQESILKLISESALFAFYKNMHAERLLSNALSAYSDDDEILLSNAATDNSEKIIDWLVRNGVNINAQSDDGSTVLHRAIRYGKSDTVKNLLDRGADVHVASAYGNALDVAIKSARLSSHYQLALIELLLAKGANVLATSGNGQSTLDIAVRKGEPLILQKILEASVAVSREQILAKLHLMLERAVLANDYDTAKTILAADASLLSRVTEKGQTLFHVAAANGQVEALKVLLYFQSIHDKSTRENTLDSYSDRSANLDADMSKRLVDLGVRDFKDFGLNFTHVLSDFTGFSFSGCTIYNTQLNVAQVNALVKAGVANFVSCSLVGDLTQIDFKLSVFRPFSFASGAKLTVDQLKTLIQLGVRDFSHCTFFGDFTDPELSMEGCIFKDAVIGSGSVVNNHALDCFFPGNGNDAVKSLAGSTLVGDLRFIDFAKFNLSGVTLRDAHLSAHLINKLFPRYLPSSGQVTRESRMYMAPHYFSNLPGWFVAAADANNPLACALTMQLLTDLPCACHDRVLAALNHCHNVADLEAACQSRGAIREILSRPSYGVQGFCGLFYRDTRYTSVH